MTPEPTSPPIASGQIPAVEAAAGGDETTRLHGGLQISRSVMYLVLTVAALSLIATVMLWQKLSNIQEQLARQSHDAATNATEARALARQAQEVVRETAARLALMESRVGEVALQRSQVEELVQSMSRSRDENMLVDIESALRLAQQQAQLSGSVEPLLMALRSADQRLERAGQPRLSRVRVAIARDIDRIKTSSVTDVPGLLAKLDDLVRQVDELPLANAVANPAGALGARRPDRSEPVRWWEQVLADIRQEARSLVRVSRIDQPEAVLLAPDQAFFLRENLKLKLLNARLALMSRLTDSARADAASASAALRKYFDPAARRTQAAATLLQQVESQLRAVELPRIDETLAVLATAAAGR
jgi:uroporphyrin-3 C-methyltransferase